MRRKWIVLSIFSACACLASLAIAPDVSAQSCYSRGSSSYRSYPSYSYSYPSYSYSYPSYSYSAPAYSYSYSKPSYSYSAPAYEKKPDYYPAYYRFLLAFPVVDLPSYGAAYTPPDNGNGVANPFVPRAGNGNGNGGVNGQQQAQGNSPDAFQKQVLDQLKTLNEGMVRLEQRVEKLERTRQPVPVPAQAPPAQPPKDESQPKKQEQLPPPEKDKDQKDKDQKDNTGVSQDKVLFETNRDSCSACHQAGKDNQGKDIPESYGGGFVMSDENGKIKDFTAEEREEIQRQLMKGKMPKLESKRAKEKSVKALTQAGADALFKELDRQVASGKKKS